MKRYVHYVIIAVAICTSILFSIYFSGQAVTENFCPDCKAEVIAVPPPYTFTISSPLFYCLFFMVIYFGGLSIADYSRHHSPHIFCNYGHAVLLSDSIHEIPYQEYLRPGMIFERLGNLTFAMTGGMMYFGFYIHGGANDPIYIFPENYKSKSGQDIEVHANLSFYEPDQLPRYVREYLEKYPRRYVAGKTPVLYGITADFDGSATASNLHLEGQLKNTNEEYTTLRYNYDSLRGFLRGRKDIQKKDYFSIGNELKPVDLEE